MKLSLRTYEPEFRTSLILVIFLSIPALLTLTKVSVLSSDVWWHIRTGEWIVEHHWVPYHDWFSTYGMGKPWFAYSWLFEITIYALFSRFGLVGLVIYVYTLMLAISIAFLSLLRSFQLPLAYSTILAASGMVALDHMRIPRPWLFTIFFFAVQINIMASVRRSRKYNQLFYLAPLFLLWANLHIQFVYGLFVLGLAAIDCPLDRFLHRKTSPETIDRSLPFSKMLFVILACLIATLINPYHIWIYGVVLDNVRQSGLYHLISELEAMDFRSLTDWVVMGLTMAAVFALGRRRDLSSFWFLLLASGVLLSFRSKRDIWFVIIVAMTIISLARPTERFVTNGISKPVIAVVIVTCAAVLWLTVLMSKVSNSKLQYSIAREYPVAAANFIEQQKLAGPLYNHFDWGGYLIWRLPNLPVSIDGRTNVHNAGRITRSAQIWNGEQSWASDSELVTARIVIAQKDLALTQLLRMVPRFRVVYEDDVSVVFCSPSASEQK